jgi:hypothetical protein
MPKYLAVVVIAALLVVSGGLGLGAFVAAHHAGTNLPTATIGGPPPPLPPPAVQTATIGGPPPPLPPPAVQTATIGGPPPPLPPPVAVVAS